MSKKIDQRLPQNSGENSGLNQYYAIKTPWEKLIGKSSTPVRGTSSVPRCAT